MSLIKEYALTVAGVAMGVCLLLASYCAYTGEVPGIWFQWVGNAAVAVFLLASAVAVLA